MKPETSKEFKVSGRLLQATPKLLSNMDHVSLYGAFLVESSIRLWVSQILWLSDLPGNHKYLWDDCLFLIWSMRAHCKGNSPDSRLAASTWEYVTPYSRGKVTGIWRGQNWPKVKKWQSCGVNPGSNSKYGLSVIGINDPDDTLKCSMKRRLLTKCSLSDEWNSQTDSRHGKGMGRQSEA